MNTAFIDFTSRQVFISNEEYPVLFFLFREIFFEVLI